MEIAFSKPTLGKEEEEAVLRVIRSGWLAAGKETEAFEKEFADFVGAKYAIFTNCGTSALKLAYKYFYERGILYYDLRTPNTFCATYAAAEEIGMMKYRGGSHGVRVATHYGGVKWDLEPQPLEIEDSAHRIEPNDPLIGKIRCYSFYVTKNMTTGAGGMLVTNDKEIYEQCKLYWRDGISTTTRERIQGRVWDYSVLAFSGGYDGNDIAAAIGCVQLKKLPEFNKRRNEIVERYNSAFGQNWTGNHLYPYFLSSEQKVPEFIEHMQKRGVACGYHYPGTSWNAVSLPLYPLLTSEESEYIIKCVKEFNAQIVVS